MEPQGPAVPPRSRSCPAARGSASLEGLWWHPLGHPICTPAGDNAAALVPLGAGVAGTPLAAQHPSPGIPRRVPRHPPGAFLCARPPWGCAVAAGRAVEGTSPWGWHSGDPPVPYAGWQLHPHGAERLRLGWPGAPSCPSPPGYHGAAHPTLGVKLPGDTRGFPPRASSRILPRDSWSSPGGGTRAQGDGPFPAGAGGHAGGTARRAVPCRAGVRVWLAGGSLADSAECRSPRESSCLAHRQGFFFFSFFFLFYL